VRPGTLAVVAVRLSFAELFLFAIRERPRFARLWHDVFAPGRSRREHAVHPREREPRRRQNRCDPGKQLERRHDAVLGAPRTGVLHAEGEAPIGKTTESRERHRRTCPIAEEAFASGVVARGDMDPCVKVEVFVLGGRAQPGGIDIRTVIAQTVLGGELREGATLHRDRSAPLDGPLLGRLVGACFEWILVDVTVPA
jgi:hypothetical protein